MFQPKLARVHLVAALSIALMVTSVAVPWHSEADPLAGSARHNTSSAKTIGTGQASQPRTLAGSQRRKAPKLGRRLGPAKCAKPLNNQRTKQTNKLCYATYLGSNRAKVIRRKSPGISPNDIGGKTQAYFPSQCSITQVGRQNPDRFTTCEQYTTRFYALSTQDGSVQGTEDLSVWEYWLLDPDSTVVTHGITVQSTFVDGVLGSGALVNFLTACQPPTAIYGDTTCNVDSETDHNTEYPDFNYPQLIGNQWAEHYTLGIPNLKLGYNDIAAFPTRLAVTPNDASTKPGIIPLFANLGGSAWRCDNTTDNSGPAGCVNPDQTPTINYNASIYPKLLPVARHVQDAQQYSSQHWGLQGYGQPLTRSTSGIDGRRNAACSTIVYQPPILNSCDEYPLASTAQGGSGASIRAVPGSANSSQGYVMMTGYRAYRVLDGDNFWIQTILPTSHNPVASTINLNNAPPDYASAPPVAAPDGTTFFVAGSTLYRLYASDYKQVIALPAPVSNLIAGADNGMWFLESVYANGAPAYKFGRLDLDSGAITTYDAPAYAPENMTLGTNGKIYFYLNTPGGTSLRFGVLSSDGTYVTFDSGINNAIANFAVGPKNSMWFTSTAGIGTLDSFGQPTFVAMGQFDTNDKPVGDSQTGNMWFRNTSSYSVTSVAADGTVQHYGAFDYNDYASSLAVSPSGGIWWGETITASGPVNGYADYVDTNGTLHRYATGLVSTTANDPACCTTVSSGAPAVDGVGAAWFYGNFSYTDVAQNQILYGNAFRLSPDGTLYSASAHAFSSGEGVAFGPVIGVDNNPWLQSPSGNAIVSPAIQGSDGSVSVTPSVNFSFPMISSNGDLWAAGRTSGSGSYFLVHMLFPGANVNGRTPPASSNVPPVAAFSSSANSLTAKLDASASYDPDGGVATYSWNFGDGTTGSGATPSHQFPATGTYTITLTVTDNSGATNTLSQSLSVYQVYASDAFNRSRSTGWGSADLGGSWTLSGSASTYSVVSSKGTMALAAASAQPAAYLKSLTLGDTDSSADLSFDSGATGNGNYAWIAARRSGTSEYRLAARVLSSGSVQALLYKLVNGTPTAITTVKVPDITYYGGSTLHLRLRVTGSGTVALAGKIWMGNFEPANWTTTTTDSTNPLGPGSPGLVGFLSATSTNAPVQVGWSNFRVTAA